MPPSVPWLVQRLNRRRVRLAEEVDKRTDTAEEKEHLLQSMEYMRWQYPRSRLFRAVPPTQREVEHGGSVLGYTLGRKISRGAFGIVCSATSDNPAEAFFYFRVGSRSQPASHSRALFERGSTSRADRAVVGASVCVCM